MKAFRRFTAIAIGAGVITAASVVRADDGCSLASLKSPYAIEGQGTVVAQPPGFPAPPAPWAESVLVDFDGAGTFSGKATVNVGGVVVKPTFTGTYTVNSDCTGNATINSDLELTVHRAIVVIGGGQRFIETETDPFIVGEGRVEKLGGQDR